ncbi:MAG: hypothetical protein KBT21_08955 [Treponema sp.]|nr:hypothetical protein [Candidatus Treponema merdequi]
MGYLLIASTYAKIVVCYFSCTGNTKTLAQSAAKALDAELFEIVPEVPYKAERYRLVQLKQQKLK